MTIVKFTRLLLNHLKLLLIAPIVVMIITFFLIYDSDKKYLSSSKVYTGFTSGNGINDNERKDFIYIKTKFSNFFENFKSRSTREEISLKTLAYYFSKDSISEKDMSLDNQLIFNKVFRKELIDSIAIKNNENKTYQNLSDLYYKNFENEIYYILNSKNPSLKNHFELERLITMSSRQEGTSDYVKIEYLTNDQGITYNTLKIATGVIIDQVKKIKSKESRNVVLFFLNESEKAKIKLNEEEQKLNTLLTKNNVINYYEQTKYLAERKENFESKFKDEKIKLEANKAIENETSKKMALKKGVVLKTSNIVELRNNIKNLNSEISKLEFKNESILDSISLKNNSENNTLTRLNIELKSVEKKLKDETNELFSMQYTPTGIKIDEIASKWLNAVINIEESSARIEQYLIFKKDFEKKYTDLSQLGSNIKQFERKIAVLEKRYLNLLSSLNDSKLKQQNIERSSSIRIVDRPFYPVKPQSSKKNLIILISGLVGFAFILGIILLLEYFDQTIKTIKNAKNITGMTLTGAFPIINNKKDNVNKEFYEKIIRQITSSINYNSFNNPEEKPFITLFYSTRKGEGKTLISNLITKEFKSSGKQVLTFKPNIQSNSEKFIFEKNDVVSYSNDSNLIDNCFYEEILKLSNIKDYDYIFIEIPNLIGNNLPIQIIKKSNLAILITKADRIWNNADKLAIKNFKKIIPNQSHFILNGVNTIELENIVGEIPKKRSKIRRLIKKYSQLNFR
jgi:polysaccharide biosynthesis transport protein